MVLVAHLTCTCTATACTIDASHLPQNSTLHYAEFAIGTVARPFALVTTAAFPLTVKGLRPSTKYSVDVRSHAPGAPSIAWGPSWGDPSPRITCETSKALAPKLPPTPTVPPPSRAAATANSKWLRVFRVSEYSFDVDFLTNHDAASMDAMPLYLMTCDPSGNCAPWSVSDHTGRWDACQQALGTLLPESRGSAFDCMHAAEAERAAIERACGAWSSQDTLEGEGSFSVHWYCGVGWPESTAAEGPITEYCVEHTPVPREGLGTRAADEVFSFYLSCNSDEVDAFGNDPRDPSCICMCLDDRLLAHQTLPTLNQDCRWHDPEMPWVNETVCNCPGTDSEVPAADYPSMSHVGRAPVYLPYVGQELKPSASYPASILGGYNFHFPKGGRCAEGASLGTDGCTWRREPVARMLYGDDLLAAGWNRSFMPDTPTDQSHTLANVAAFARAVGALDQLMAPPACGE